ncbi:MAG: hypothetical protein ACKOJF_28785, partial [Planctomycetaceae bacterium]
MRLEIAVSNLPHRLIGARRRVRLTQPATAHRTRSRSETRGTLSRRASGLIPGLASRLASGRVCVRIGRR